MEGRALRHRERTSVSAALAGAGSAVKVRVLALLLILQFNAVHFSDFQHFFLFNTAVSAPETLHQSGI